MNKYVRAIRIPFLAGSVSPVLIGVSLAYIEGYFLLWNFIAALTGVAALHTAANLINDYYDSKGSDAVNIKVTPFSGGSRAIQEEGLSAAAVKKMAIFFLLVAFITMVFMIIEDRPMVVPIGLLGLFIGWAYSTPPLQLMSKGWGETIIFFAFGPLVTLGAYYAITGAMTVDSFLLGIPQGFLITGVIWINEFPDYDADKSVGKKNLVVRMGPGKARYLYCLIMSMSFVSVLIITALCDITAMILLAFISFPLAFRAMRITWKDFTDHEKIVPSQALTVQTVLTQGLLISLGLILSHFIN